MFNTEKPVVEFYVRMLWLNIMVECYSYTLLIDMYSVLFVFHNSSYLSFFSFLVGDDLLKVRNVANIRNQYNQVPHLTHDTTWESNKNTIKHHK